MAAPVGCSGWLYRDWRGVVYPAELPQRRWFEHYTTVFDTVELQNAMERSYARPAYKLDGMEVTYERAGAEDRVRLFAAPQAL